MLLRSTKFGGENSVRGLLGRDGVTSCSIAAGYQLFGGPCCLLLQGEVK